MKIFGKLMLPFLVVGSLGTSVLSQNKTATPTTSKASREDLKINFLGLVLKQYLEKTVIVNEQATENIKETILPNCESEDLKDKLIAELKSYQMVISIYGMKSDEEFFAEAFSKWSTTPYEMRNISWLVLNEFFTKFLPNFLNKIGGDYLTNFDEIQETLNEYKPQYFYNTDSQNVSTPEVILDYPGDFGYSNYNYTYSFFKNFAENEINNSIEKCDLSLNYADKIANLTNKWNNDSITTISKAQKDGFEDFYQTNPTYQNFEELDQKLKKASKISNIYSEVESGIELKDTTNQVAQMLGWNESEKTKLENNFLKLFNIMGKLLGSELNASKLLTNIIVSNDLSIVKPANENVIAYTGGTYSPELKSIVSTNQVYSMKTFKMPVESNGNLQQYSSMFWSTPEKFAVIFHETGHALDNFAGTTKPIRLWKSTMQKGVNPKDIYSGSNILFNSGFKNSPNSILIVVIAIPSIIFIIGSPLILMFIFLKKGKSKK
ncbi:hypothetical protein SSABA_v1c03080 [Spiroplasma sabaudiense Ar-1343]|uniref:Uncharacterized protein n=1 Tax=Spiroplasma sabaudiense Ar-1343 TaxID=1276257 RepID=W6AA62_9MOLU|nr:hypothetical protein [Spiroplasma sabaudiense]AHI53720.1 hypothetical protein SSABA_v1c03080 [Spiroplasma sabaudiense Ar-1343]